MLLPPFKFINERKNNNLDKRFGWRIANLEQWSTKLKSVFKCSMKIFNAVFVLFVEVGITRKGLLLITRVHTNLKTTPFSFEWEQGPQDFSK